MDAPIIITDTIPAITSDQFTSLVFTPLTKDEALDLITYTDEVLNGVLGAYQGPSYSYPEWLQLPKWERVLVPVEAESYTTWLYINYDNTLWHVTLP